MDSTPPDSVQTSCDSGQQFHLPHIYDNEGCVASCNSSYITCMAVTTPNSSHPIQAKFDTDEFSIGIDTQCYVIMSHYNKDYVGPLERRRSVINGFEGPKVHTIYRSTINCNINHTSVHPHRL